MEALVSLAWPAGEELSIEKLVPSVRQPWHTPMDAIRKLGWVRLLLRRQQLPLLHCVYRRVGVLAALRHGRDVDEADRHVHRRARHLPRQCPKVHLRADVHAGHVPYRLRLLCTLDPIGVAPVHAAAFKKISFGEEA